MNAALCLFVAASMVAVAACSPSTAPAPGMTNASPFPVCTEAELLAHRPDNDEVKAHREGDVPVIHVPFDSRKEWEGRGVDLGMRVDVQGRPVCYSATRMPNKVVPLEAAHVARLAALRYRPFLWKGQPVPAVVYESVREEELPGPHVPTPQVPLEDVRIRLERTACYGPCPSYTVEVRGDGNVTYTGNHRVDVQGTHAYKVPVEDVARLVESLRAKDLWSMRSSYRSPVTDNPTYDLTIDLGGQVKRIDDYAGDFVGIPRVIGEFQDEVDEVTQTDSWIHLSRAAVARLEAERFDFKSQEAGRLLARAKASRSDPAAIARLIELGAPLDVEAEPVPSL